MATRHRADDSGISWRVHAVWAMLVLLPFLVPQVMLALGGDGERVTTTLAFYGPAITAVWVAGHATILHAQRERRHRAPSIPAALTPPH